MAKADTAPIYYRQLYRDLVHTKYRAYSKLFTDGSKNQAGTGAACIFNNITRTASLPPEANILTAIKTHAINMAINLIQELPEGPYIIMTDSRSCLESIAAGDGENDYTRRLLHKIHNSALTNRHVELCWIPSHVGIHGNEKADRAAKSATERPPELIPINHKNWTPLITTTVKAAWNARWQSSTHQLHSTNPQIGSCITLPKSTRREAVVLNRVRLGYTRLTHGYLMDASAPQISPICEFCQEVTLTIPHLLTRCHGVNPERRLCFPTDENYTLQEMLNNENRLLQLIKFLKVLEIFDSI